MIDKLKKAFQETADTLREQAAAFGEGAKEKGFQLIEEWLLIFPKLELSTHRFAWVPYLRTMFEQSQTIQDAPMSAACALHVGHLYYLNGEYAIACTWLEQAHAFFAEAKDGRGQAQALNMLAWVALRTDRSGEAAALAAVRPTRDSSMSKLWKETICVIPRPDKRVGIT